MKSDRKAFVLLHALLMLYSCSGILSKLATRMEFLSAGFIMCYGGMIALLGVYAICWQQLIKRMPLTTAYANRAITVVWGVIWGLLVFHEGVSVMQLCGCALVVAGVALFALSDGNAQ